MKMIFLAIGVGALPAFTQAVPRPTVIQQGGSCAVTISGNSNTGSVTCAGVDRKLAEQIRDIVNSIKGNLKALNTISTKLETIRKELGGSSAPIINLSSEGHNSPNTAIVGNGNNVTVNPDRGWRPLTDQEISDVAAALAPFAGQKVSIVVSNPEADRMALAQQLARLFRAAKWEVLGIQTPMVFFDPNATYFPHGIVLHVGQVNRAVETLGNILIRLFGQVNVPNGFNDEKFAKDQIEVNVWPRAK